MECGEIYILIHNERSKRIKCRYKTDCISGESNRESTDIRTGIDIPTTYDHTDIQSRYRLDMNYKYEIYGIQHLPRDRGKVYKLKQKNGNIYIEIK